MEVNIKKALSFLQNKKEASKVISQVVVGSRLVGYALESLLFQQFEKIFRINPEIQNQLVKEDLKELQNEIKDLILKDSQLFADGILPLAALVERNLIHHGLILPALFYDYFSQLKVRKEENHNLFDEQSQNYLDEVPEYYKRNFHYQKNGYLSRQSGQIYEDQVEVLFRGTADLMRRAWIKPFLESASGKYDHKNKGIGLKGLELGCGVGSATRFLRALYPQASIIGLDPSLPYLQLAKERFIDYERLSFIHGYGESLVFETEAFDFIYSVFLFHELPLEIRKKVLSEASRVLKKDGYFIFVDSLQEGDTPKMDQQLKLFPQLFHEPFYTNYIKTPIVELAKEFGLNAVATGTAMAAKYVVFKKIN
jgi:ubiquinone/menaquinone biosynthesis C-methylase UbiE